MWDPQRLTTLWAFTACDRDSFTFFTFYFRYFIQGIRPGPRLLMIFRNKLIFLRWGAVSPTLNPQAGGPPLIGCPRLLIQYIRSFPPSATWGRAMLWWQGPNWYGVAAQLAASQEGLSSMSEWVNGFILNIFQMKCVNKIQRKATHISVHCHLHDLLLHAIITGLVSPLNGRQGQSVMMFEVCAHV
jgi:hypothetical protein